MKIFKYIIIVVIMCQICLAQTKSVTVLPVRYDEHRFFVEPVTKDGIKMCFYTDTGGGLFIFKDVVEKLKLPVQKTDETETVKLPEFVSDRWIPTPLGSSEYIFVFSERDNNDWLLQDCSGLLGQQWLAGRIWQFDYPQKRLILVSELLLKKKDNNHLVKLGFKTDRNGVRETNFPRIQAIIDNDTIDFLFDTGATMKLSEAGLELIKDQGKAIRATSFITQSVYEKWRKNHPDWKVIKKAEERTDAAMIEVPQMKIAGYKVKSVWFTVRPDKSFHEYMSQWMDKKVEGAIGGNAFKNFRITVDYPQATAFFEK